MKKPEKTPWLSTPTTLDSPLVATENGNEKKAKKALDSLRLNRYKRRSLVQRDSKTLDKGGKKKQQAVKKKIDRESLFRYSHSPVAMATEMLNRVFEN